MERYEQIIANADHYHAIGLTNAYLEIDDVRPWHLVTAIEATNGHKVVQCKAQVTPELAICWWYKALQGEQPAPDLKDILGKLSTEMHHAFILIIKEWEAVIEAEQDDLALRFTRLNACARLLKALHTP